MTALAVEPTGTDAREVHASVSWLTRIWGLLHDTVAWLPRGRVLPEALWSARHRWISRFALAQAVGIGVFALFRGASPTAASLDVLIVGVPALMGLNETVGRRMCTICETVSLMFASATFVDVAGGVTEAHFHFFVMLGIVALYQDWTAFLVCILITVAHHSLMGLWDPDSCTARRPRRGARSCGR